MKIRPARLCYTSGTTGAIPRAFFIPTGQPFYMHGQVAPKMSWAYRQAIVFLQSYPCFTLARGGLVYSCAMMGCKLVMPGPGLDGKSLTDMIRQEQVTYMLGVPTIWMGILNHIRAEDGDLKTTLRQDGAGWRLCPPRSSPSRLRRRT